MADYYGPRDMLKPEYLAPWFEERAKGERNRQTTNEELSRVWREDAKRFDEAAKAIRSNATLLAALQKARGQIVAFGIDSVGSANAVAAVKWLDDLLHEFAQGRLSALEAGGMVMVPLTLTKHMAVAFDEACGSYLNYNDAYGDDEAAAQVAWNHLLAARPQGGPND